MPNERWQHRQTMRKSDTDKEIKCRYVWLSKSELFTLFTSCYWYFYLLLLYSFVSPYWFLPRLQQGLLDDPSLNQFVRLKVNSSIFNIPSQSSFFSVDRCYFNSPIPSKARVRIVDPWMPVHICRFMLLLTSHIFLCFSIFFLFHPSRCSFCLYFSFLSLFSTLLFSLRDLLSLNGT